MLCRRVTCLVRGVTSLVFGRRGDYYCYSRDQAQGPRLAVLDVFLGMSDVP